MAFLGGGVGGLPSFNLPSEVMSELILKESAWDLSVSYSVFVILSLSLLFH